MTMKQRNMKNKKIAFIGAKVDSDLHSEFKHTAIRENVSLSTLVERALREFVENKLKKEC